MIGAEPSAYATLSAKCTETNVRREINCIIGVGIPSAVLLQGWQNTETNLAGDFSLELVVGDLTCRGLACGTYDWIDRNPGRCTGASSDRLIRSPNTTVFTEQIKPVGDGHVGIELENVGLYQVIYIAIPEHGHDLDVGNDRPAKVRKLRRATYGINLRTVPRSRMVASNTGMIAPYLNSWRRLRGLG